MKALVSVRDERSSLTLSAPQSRLPLLVIAIGMLFTLSLQFYIQPGVFYSGDGGLKALLTQQLAVHPLHFNLDLPAPDWARSLWQEGLYPFTPPYVYHPDGHYFITFPFTFPSVTAPFYALFGYRGLYIVPVISLWILWLKVYSLCKQLRISSSVTITTLLILIFASPLSFYSGMYWEHTLAVTLAFCGLTNFLFPFHRLSTRSTILSGILVGLSVWFRPEFLCLVGAICLGLLAAQLKFLQLPSLTLKRSIAFASSLILTIAGFFALNQAIYHHPLGIHALQVVEETSLREKLPVIASNFQQLGLLLIQYFPVLLLPILFLLLPLFNSKIELTSRVRLLYLIGFLFIISVPLIVPEGAGGKQWGPRFLLLIVPLASLLVAIGLDAVLKVAKRRLKLVVWGMVWAVLTVSLHINAYGGSLSLQQTYQAIAPTIQALQKNPNTVIGMSHQFIAQVFAAPLPGKIFFRTETTDALKKLGMATVAQGQEEFLYLCYPHRPCTVLEENPEGIELSVAGRSYWLEFSDLQIAGKYPAYRVKIAAVRHATDISLAA